MPQGRESATKKALPMKRLAKPANNGRTNLQSNTLAMVRDALLLKLLSGELQIPNAKKFLERLM